MPPCPEHRYLAVRALADDPSSTAPTHEIDAGAYAYLRQAPDVPDVIADAFAIYESKYTHVMDALILSLAKPEDVQQDLELPDGVYAVYCHLFFDRTVFRSVFAMRAFVEELDITEQERQLYELALVEGPARLLDRFRIKPRRAADPQTVMAEVMTDAFSRSTEHRGRPLTSKTAQAALALGRTAMGAAQAIKQSHGGERVAEALAQLEMVLISKSTSTTPAELGVARGDIITG